MPTYGRLERTQGLALYPPFGRIGEPAPPLENRRFLLHRLFIIDQNKNVQYYNLRKCLKARYTDITQFMSFQKCPKMSK